MQIIFMYINKDTLALNAKMFTTAINLIVNCANNLHDHPKQKC